MLQSMVVVRKLTHAEREALRATFRPDHVRLLFIGEAPPASGRFFYSGNSGLYRAMREAFQEADPGIQDERFLQAFQASGCYLADLCPEPVDGLDVRSRRSARDAAERGFADQLATLQPARIAPVLRAIVKHVERAAWLANWQGQMIELPYPGRWSHLRAEFTRELAPVLRELLDSAK